MLLTLDFAEIGNVYCLDADHFLFHCLANYLSSMKFVILQFWVRIHQNCTFQQDGYSFSQYGYSQSEKKLGVGDKYNRSIKVHTQETQNHHQLKSPLSDLTTLNFKGRFFQTNKFFFLEQNFFFPRFVQFLMYFKAKKIRSKSKMFEKLYFF